VLRSGAASPGGVTLGGTFTAARAASFPDVDITVVGLDATQTLTAKTLTSPTIITSPTAAGATWTDLGSVTTADINGGTVDGAIIGGASSAAGTFTAMTSTSANLSDGDITNVGDVALDSLSSDAAGQITISPTTDTIFSNGTGVVIGHTATVAVAGITAELEILGTGYGDSAVTQFRWSADAAPPYVIFGKSRGATIGSNTVLNSGDEITQLLFVGDDGSTYRGSAAISVFADGAWGASDVPGRISMWTVPDGGTGLAEHLRIASDGGIYAYNLLAAAASTDININGSNELHSVTSARVYKDDIHDLGGAAGIYDLQPRRFTWNDRSGSAGVDDFGLIADEVADVYPQAVVYKDFLGADGLPGVDGFEEPYSVRYQMLSVLLLAELQTLNERVAALEASAGG
jgi:hypothetical protein